MDRYEDWFHRDGVEYQEELTFPCTCVFYTKDISEKDDYYPEEQTYCISLETYKKMAIEEIKSL
ncbi:hypothetical protein [Bacillus sp. UMB0728]|uniref:hypothetical protein n=1 Tax=Bacillus sp. UMB0728 TaxID=2066052 RepID=UPI00115B5906|nr:hypothetical protein [Bacillus sp. UMB0728]